MSWTRWATGNQKLPRSVDREAASSPDPEIRHHPVFLMDAADPAEHVGCRTARRSIAGSEHSNG
jgi:hypothetical protein